MATTSDMNTPEHEIKNNSIHENTQESIDKLQARLVQQQLRRLQGRDYGRILREYNTPAQWYQPTPITRSVYYYDPNNQKYLQQQPQRAINVRLNLAPIRVPNQSKSRIRYTSNSYNPQQKSTLPSRLRSVPVLPPIITTHKKSIEE